MKDNRIVFTFCGWTVVVNDKEIGNENYPYKIYDSNEYICDACTTEEQAKNLCAIYAMEEYKEEDEEE